MKFDDVKISYHDKKITQKEYRWVCPKTGQAMTSFVKPRIWNDLLSEEGRKLQYDEYHKQWLAAFDNEHNFLVGAIIMEIVPDDEYWVAGEEPGFGGIKELRLITREGKRVGLAPDGALMYISENNS